MLASTHFTRLNNWSFTYPQLPTALGGDFNALHDVRNDLTSTTVNNSCRRGLHIQLNNFPGVTFLNTHIHTHTHLSGGLLDLTCLSSNLLPFKDWTLHPVLTSDHFATSTSLQLPPLTLAPSCPRWNFSSAEWCLLNIMEHWAENYSHHLT